MKGGREVDWNNDKTSNNLSPIQEFIAALGYQMRSDAPLLGIFWAMATTPGPNWLAALFDWWSRTVCNASLKSACARVINQGFLPGFYSWQGAKQPQPQHVFWDLQYPDTTKNYFRFYFKQCRLLMGTLKIFGRDTKNQKSVVNFRDGAVFVGSLKTKESPTYIFWFLVPAELTVCVLLQSCFNVLCMWLYTGYTLDIKLGVKLAVVFFKKTNVQLNLEVIYCKKENFPWKQASSSLKTPHWPPA